MQIHQKQITNNPELPPLLKKEIRILYQLGLSEYEIEYLIFLKTKKQISSKWN